MKRRIRRRYKRRPRRRFKRKYGRRRMRNGVQPVMRKYRIRYSNAWLWDTVTTAGFWRYFSTDVSSTFPGIADMLNCFEEYKVCKLKFEYFPNFDNVTAADPLFPSTSAIRMPMYFIQADPRTGTTVPTGTYSPTTLDTFLAECPNAKILKPGDKITTYYTPTVQNDINTTANRMWMKAPWLKTTAGTQVHNGHHMFIWGNDAQLLTGLKLEVWVTAYVKFRGTRV